MDCFLAALSYYCCLLDYLACLTTSCCCVADCGLARNLGSTFQMRCIASSVVIGILRTIDSNVFENHGSITLLTGLKYSFELIRFFILTEELLLAPPVTHA